MRTVDLSWKRVTKVWWSFIWRGTVVAFFADTMIRASLAGVQDPTVRWALTTLLMLPAGILIWVAVMRRSLKIPHSDFSIVLLRDPLGARFNRREVTWPRATRNWWSWTWRVGAVVMLLSLLGGAVGAPEGLTLLTVSAIGIPIGIVAMRATLKLHYSGFRIALVPYEDAGFPASGGRVEACAAMVGPTRGPHPPIGY